MPPSTPPAAPAPLVLLAGPGAFGGAQRHLAALLVHLPAPLGRPLALVVQGEPGPQLRAAAAAGGAPVVVLPGGADAAAAALPGALQDLGSGRVHLNATDPAAEAHLLRAALATGARTSAVVHLSDRWARTPPPPDAAALLRRLDVALAPSREIAGHLVTAQGLDPDRVVHVPNGVAVPDAPQRPAPPAAGSGRGTGRPLRVACLARLTPQKGVDVLVDAVALVARTAPGAVEVVVAGEGRDGAALRERAAGLPLAWAGFAADTAAVLAGADAYVQPSRDDALPLALLEAAGAGLPCAATRVGDVAEHLGDVVLVVEPEDPAALAAALAELARDPALRARLAAAGRARVLEGFTEAAFARRTAAALRAAVPATPAPSPAGAPAGTGR